MILVFCWDMQNVFETCNFSPPNRTADFRIVWQFRKVTIDPTTASRGRQPLMNLTFVTQF